MTRDRVSQDLWTAVVDRDAKVLWGWSGSTIPFSEWRFRNRLICIVPMLDPSESGRCSGHTTVDHVKDAPMMGRRAPSDMSHLVAMCSFHHVEHPPSRALRQLEREYLGLI